MSGRGWHVDERITRTVAILLRCPGLLVPETMWAGKLFLEESGNPAKQMAVRRSFAKANGGKAIAPPPSVINALTVGMTTVLPLTGQITEVGTPMTPTPPPMTPTLPAGGMQTTQTWAKPNQKLIRKSAVGMQKFWINKLEALDHAKLAPKRATRWYAQEKDKPGGLSLLQIAKKVKQEYDGFGPSHDTIWVFRQR